MGSNLKFLLLKPSGRNTPLTRGTSFALYLYVINQVVMKNLFFSGLIFCGALFVTAQTNGQSFANNGDVITVSPADHSGLFAYAELNNIILQWSTGNDIIKLIPCLINCRCKLSSFIIDLRLTIRTYFRFPFYLIPARLTF